MTKQYDKDKNRTPYLPRRVGIYVQKIEHIHPPEKPCSNQKPTSLPEVVNCLRNIEWYNRRCRGRGTHQEKRGRGQGKEEGAAEHQSSN